MIAWSRLGCPPLPREWPGRVKVKAAELTVADPWRLGQVGPWPLAAEVCLESGIHSVLGPLDHLGPRPTNLPGAQAIQGSQTHCGGPVEDESSCGQM